MRIAILGANGFIARKLCEKLIFTGHEVVGIVRKIPEKKILNLIYISTEEMLEVQNIDCDVAINLMAKRRTRFDSATENELMAANFSLPQQFLFKVANSCELFINFATYIQNFKGHPAVGIDRYSELKNDFLKFSNDFSKNYSFKTLNLFLFTIYGEGDHDQHLIPAILSSARSNQILKLSPGYQFINLLHVDDLVNNLMLQLNLDLKSKTTNYTFWNEEYLTIRSLVSSIETVLGIEIPVEWGAREYTGHEMHDIWPRPFPVFPNLNTTIELSHGLQRLWT